LLSAIIGQNNLSAICKDFLASENVLKLNLTQNGFESLEEAIENFIAERNYGR